MSKRCSFKFNSRDEARSEILLLKSRSIFIVSLLTISSRWNEDSSLTSFMWDAYIFYELIIGLASLEQTWIKSSRQRIVWLEWEWDSSMHFAQIKPEFTHAGEMHTIFKGNLGCWSQKNRGKLLSFKLKFGIDYDENSIFYCNNFSD
jgi:hypothetical protein